MKKGFFFIIILAAIIFFAGADYLFNTEKLFLASLPTSNDSSGIETKDIVISTPESYKNLTEDLLSSDQNTYGYSIVKRNRVAQLFETIDLSQVNNIVIFQNKLQHISKDPSRAITVYEVHGLSGQGSLTYLNIKLKFIKQIDENTSINEIGGYGQNSLFFNNKNDKKTAFLLVQIADNLFGFKYSKESPETFEAIKQMLKKASSSALLLN